MKDRRPPKPIYPPGTGNPAGTPDQAERVRLLGQLVHRYAWCRVDSFWAGSGYPDYLLVVELPDGRRFWRCLADPLRTPDEIVLGWASYPPAKWFRQFRAKGKGSHLWTEYFGFWQVP